MGRAEEPCSGVSAGLGPAEEPRAFGGGAAKGLADGAAGGGTEPLRLGGGTAGAGSGAVGADARAGAGAGADGGGG